MSLLKITEIRLDIECLLCELSTPTGGRTMSTDLAFWKSSRLDPSITFANLCEEITEGIEHSSDVLRFREQILARWPQLSDYVEPLNFPDMEPMAYDLYVLLPLGGKVRELIPELVEMARTFGLVVYSAIHGDVV